MTGHTQHSGTQIGLSASLGKIQTEPLILTNTGSGPLQTPEDNSFHFTKPSDFFAPFQCLSAAESLSLSINKKFKV